MRGKEPAFPDLKGQAPLRSGAIIRIPEDVAPFPDLKGQAPLRRKHLLKRGPADPPLFLTSKVRLHCDSAAEAARGLLGRLLFLTSKVRLHCDPVDGLVLLQVRDLFLTSKVRLHCDWAGYMPCPHPRAAFPDLKGQAPLRPAGWWACDFGKDFS